MLKFNWLVVALSVSLGINAFAAPSPTDASADPAEIVESPVVSELKTEVPAEPSQGSFTGTIEFRPSQNVAVGQAYSESLAEVGYRFNPNFRAAYQLQFNTNFNDPMHPGIGAHPQVMAHFLRFTMSNLWKSGDWSLAYEPRLYLPAATGWDDSKHYLSMRNYVMLTKKMTENYSITFMEIPIFHWYGARGVGSTPNSYFENRVYIMNDFSFGKLTVSLPILWNMPRMLEYGGKPSVVRHNVWIWPEVAYAVDPNVQVGAAYYTSSLVASDLSDTTLGGPDGGFANGVLQFILRASL